MIPARALDALRHQTKLVVIQRLLQAVHHLDFHLHRALHVVHPGALQAFGKKRRQRQIRHGAHLAQQQRQMAHRRADIAVAHANLRLQRHAVPDKAKRLDALIQRLNTLFMKLGIQAQHHVVPGQLIHQLIGIEHIAHPGRELLLIVDPQHHAVVAPQQIQLGHAHQKQHRPGRAGEILIQRPQIRQLNDGIDIGDATRPGMQFTLARADHCHKNNDAGEHRKA